MVAEERLVFRRRAVDEVEEGHSLRAGRRADAAVEVLHVRMGLHLLLQGGVALRR